MLSYWSPYSAKAVKCLSIGWCTNDPNEEMSVQHPASARCNHGEGGFDIAEEAVKCLTLHLLGRNTKHVLDEHPCYATSLRKPALWNADHLDSWARSALVCKCATTTQGQLGVAPPNHTTAELDCLQEVTSTLAIVVYRGCSALMVSFFLSERIHQRGFGNSAQTGQDRVGI
ncbi:hypothetical protein P3T76_015503 [Phytophthora citrophthora]|uniref:Uncharacterized protein n=1 Tax=Phytophthora citrophthora TaxID=4793 RepID=A0AAD9LAA0_9STRA|nr:hypothetical protein P3T76_015503 [Phytophthora citrophthora]